MLADATQLGIRSCQSRDQCPRCHARRRQATDRDRQSHLDVDYAALHAEVAAGDYALVEVTDSGAGMAAEISERVFEPFYTTKEQGKGTGLGLSMVFGFIKQSGGHVSVYSEINVGTTFRLYLPRAHTIEAATSEAKPSAVSERGSETILVVDDNPALRRLVMRQVQAMGYRVLEADGPAAALACLAAEPVDLLFTDVVMPGSIDGIMLARQAVQQWPKLKVILTSGFPELKLNGHAGEARLLSKPYRAEELAHLLRKILNK